jgi:WD40 repeat protein
MNIRQLIAELAPRVSGGVAVAAVEALRRRSLLERVETNAGSAFTLQSVVLEYVTDRLVEEVADEIATGRPARLIDQPLVKAQAKDYVRQSQERLIGLAVLQRLEAEPGRQLLALLEGWRNRPVADQGYGPGNVVNLVRLARGDLRGTDLAHLSIRQAYLATVEVQDASLAGADLSEAVLAEAFNFPLSVALSGDGTSLVAGTSGGEVWLWRVADRTPLLALAAHSGQVYGVAVTADGRVLASGGLDGLVRLWAAPSGRLLATLQAHTGVVCSVALSADGSLLASSSFDGTVRIWEAPIGRLLATLHGHAGGIRSVAVSADGGVLASGGMDGTARLWDTTDGRPLATLRGHADVVWSVALSADGSLLASGGLDRTVRLWDARDGRLLATLQGHTGGVRSVMLSSDGRLLASAGFDGIIRLWETANGELLSTLRGHTHWVYTVALSEDGRLLASGSEDGTIRLWDTPVAPSRDDDLSAQRRASSGDTVAHQRGPPPCPECRWKAARRRERGRNGPPLGAEHQAPAGHTGGSHRHYPWCRAERRRGVTGQRQ